jgi:hypothetical protein
MWDDVQRFWATEAEEPFRLAPSELSWDGYDQDELPVVLAAGVWIAIALILFGAVVAGLVVVAVTAVGWALWRNRPWAGGMPADMPDDPARPLGIDERRGPGRRPAVHAARRATGTSARPRNTAGSSRPAAVGRTDRRLPRKTR